MLHTISWLLCYMNERYGAKARESEQTLYHVKLEA